MKSDEIESMYLSELSRTGSMFEATKSVATANGVSYNKIADVRDAAGLWLWSHAAATKVKRLRWP